MRTVAIFWALMTAIIGAALGIIVGSMALISLWVSVEAAAFILIAVMVVAVVAFLSWLILDEKRWHEDLKRAAGRR